MTTTYLTHLPRKYIRTVAGHELEGSYFVPRDSVQPPEELKSLVFPWVDDDLKELNRKGSSYEKNLASRGFLRLMEYLKVVLLQDAVMLRTHFPEHPVFKHNIFQTTAFKEFSVQVRAAENNPEYPIHLRLQAAIPDVEGQLRIGRQEVNSHFSHVHSDIQRMQKGLDRLDRQVRGVHEHVVRLSNAQIEIPPVRAQLVLPAPTFHDETAAASASAFANAQCQPSNGSLIGTIQPRQRSPPNPTANPTANPTVNPSGSVETVPQLKLDRSVTTVVELWDEWHYGRGGKPPINELNERFGAQWRLTDRTFYSRRLRLIQAIYEEAKITGRVGQEEEVAQEVEDLRIRDKKHLNQMIRVWAGKRQCVQQE
jgi:hypothetical protein